MIVEPHASRISTELDPAWLDPVSYVAFLNCAFPGQWSQAAYDWYVARGFRGRRSELLVRAEGTRVIAGITLCYRQVSIDASMPIDICILSAAATLPAARGRGHYDSLLQAAHEHARSKTGVVALMAFVTRDNASGRGLIRLGAHAIPSFYIVSPGRVRPITGTFRRSARAIVRRARQGSRRLLSSMFATLGREAVSTRTSSQTPTVRFHYERAEDWMQQFVGRPQPVRAVRLSHDSHALIESVGDTDRLQWLAGPHHSFASNITSLAAASLSLARKFFMYTLDPRQAAAARRIGLRVRDGYLLLLPTDRSHSDWRTLTSSAWSVQSGDRL